MNSEEPLMNSMNLKDEIRNFVISNFLFGEAEHLEDDTPFMENGIIDSTGILELVMFLETTYKIKIQNEEMLPQNFDSIERVARFVSKKVNNVPVSAANEITIAHL
ncbi:MAG TPA: acyl carrier protein [Verrucomicrobiae bacterium]|nr:acyl carrier protein [Verrucomicrobiae bacterium]